MQNRAGEECYFAASLSYFHKIFLNLLDSRFPRGLPCKCTILQEIHRMTPAGISDAGRRCKILADVQTQTARGENVPLLLRWLPAQDRASDTGHEFCRMSSALHRGQPGSARFHRAHQRQGQKTFADALTWQKSGNAAHHFGPIGSRKTGARSYHRSAFSHKTCNFARVPLLSAIETGLQSRWVVNAG